jgi:hypothetical protein
VAYDDKTAALFFKWFAREVSAGRKPQMTEITRKFGLSAEDVEHIKLRAKAVQRGRISK